VVQKPRLKFPLFNTEWTGGVLELRAVTQVPEWGSVEKILQDFSRIFQLPNIMLPALNRALKKKPRRALFKTYSK